MARKPANGPMHETGGAAEAGVEVLQHDGDDGGAPSRAAADNGGRIASTSKRRRMNERGGGEDGREPVAEVADGMVGSDGAEEGVKPRRVKRRSRKPEMEGAQGADDSVDDESAEAAGDEARPVVDGVPLTAVVEALLFSTDAPLSARKIAHIVECATVGMVKRCIEQLNGHYERCGSSFRVEGLAGGYQMLTLPQFDRWLGALRRARAESRLSGAALETLAIVAYRQPIIRADIEAIRGVACGDLLKRLREVNLVRIVGRAEEVGRPVLYGTTTRFLDLFGLASLEDLPRLEGGGLPTLRLKEPQEEKPSAVPATVEEDDGAEDEPAVETEV